MPLLRLLLLLCVLTNVNDLLAQEDYPYSRLRVDLSETSILKLAFLGLEVDHGIYARGRFLINDFSSAEKRRLEAAGIPYTVEIADLNTYYSDPYRDPVTGRNANFCRLGEAAGYPVPKNFTFGSMAGFYTYEELTAILLDMQQKYPDLIHGPDTIPGHQTIEGRPIYWLRVSDNPTVDEDEPEVLYTALHHAREPNSLTQMIFYLWHILENYDNDEQIKYLIDESEMYFLPCINPDGYIFNQINNPDGGGLWRKNRRIVDGSNVGVDLNRNYGFSWGYDDSGSSPSPGSQTYRGEGPFSEPETQAVRSFCNDHEFRIALNYHTSGNLLIYPWGFLDTLPPDSNIFLTLSRNLTQQNSYLAGTGTETVGYTVNGDSDDWMYGETNEKGLIFSLTPEVGGDGFWPPMSQIIPECQGTVFMNLATVAALHNNANLIRKDDELSFESEDSFSFTLEHTGLTGGNIQVALTPIDAPWLEIDEPIQQVDLPSFGTADLEFEFELNNSLAPGTSFQILAEIDNGDYLRYDTLSHLYLGTDLPNWIDRFDNLSNWVSGVNGGWFLTDEDFVSPEFSLTDSPFSEYGSNVNQQVQTIDYQTVPEGLASAFVFFKAKWDIETNYDYVQLFLLVNNESFVIPLCGKYSKAGSGFQTNGEPVWDGAQEEWVQEMIDITEFIEAGDQIAFRFQLVSDNFVQEDGFYVDDFSLYFLEEQPNNTTELSNLVSSIDIYPQPTSDQVSFAWPDYLLAEDLLYQLYTINGRLIQTASMGRPQTGQIIDIDVASMASGIYLLQLLTDSQVLGQFKIIKQ